MSIVRVAIVGLGQMGAEHCKNIALLNSTARVVAAMDPTPESSQKVLADLQANSVLDGDVSLFNNLDQLISADLADAFVVASPNFTHIDVLRKLIPTGKHILVEKPLCTTLQDCREVAALAQTTKAVVWVGMEYRYMRPIARLIEEVEGGTVGSLKMIAIREHRYPFLIKVNDWNRFNQNTGGTMVEKCCHFFDLMVRIAKSQPVSVYCSGAQDVNHLDENYNGQTPDIVDNSLTIVQFENGVRASLDLCMFAECSRNQEEISVVGDRGKVEALIPESVVYIGRRKLSPITNLPPSEEEKRVEEVRLHVDEALLQAGYHEGSTFFELSNFFNAIATSTPPEVSVADGLLAVAMGLAAEKSIREGRVVLMSELEAQS